MTASHKTTAGQFRQRLLATSVLAMGVAAVLGLGAAPAFAKTEKPQPPAVLPGSNSPEVNDLLRKAHQALAQGHPNVAVIYLKNAVGLAPRNGNVHAELGLVLLRSGNAPEAERELRAARQYGMQAAQVLPLLYEAMLARHEAALLLSQFPAPAAADHSALASDTLRARAVALMQTNRPQEAAQALDQALSFNRDVRNLTARAGLAHDQGDTATALKLTDEALTKTPNDPQALLLKISLLQAANKPADALAAADSFVKSSKASAVSLLARAAVYLQLHRDADALADVNIVLGHAPSTPLAVYYKALLRERAKDPKGAWALAQTLPPEFVRSRPETGIAISQMAAGAGHREIATSVLAGIVGKFPDNAEARIRLAGAYLQLKDAGRALSTLAPLENSQDPRAMVLAGQAYAMEKQYGKSIEYLEKASATGFGGDLLKRQIAASNLRVGNLDAAVDELKQLFAKEPGKPEVAGPLIAALLRKGDAGGALGTANKFAATAPKDPYGPLFQGQILLGRGDLDGAVGAFTRALALNPKFVPASYDRAVALAARGDLKAANADLAAVLADDPKNVMAMIKSAEIAMKSGDGHGAEALLQRAAASAPKDIVPNLALVEFYLQQHRAKDAAAAVEKFLRAAPGNPSGIAMRGDVQLASGQAAQAAETFRQLAGNQPDSPQVQMLLAGALAASKDTKGALGAYQKAVELAPSYQDARAALVRYALATNNGDTALKAAKAGTVNDPGPRSDALLAATLLALKQPGEAEAVLTRSLAKTPNPGVLLSLSQLLRQTGNAQKADALLTGWLARNPNDAAVRLEYGESRLTSDPALAEQQFRLVLKVQPYNLVALNNLAWLLQTKSPKEALGYAERAARLAPNAGPVLDTLGWIKWNTNDRAGALSLLKRAHAADAGNAEIAYHLVVALDGTGDRADAKKLLDALVASKATFDDRKTAEALSAKWR